jgi:hypothetical protein
MNGRPSNVDLNVQFIAALKTKLQREEQHFVASRESRKAAASRMVEGPEKAKADAVVIAFEAARAVKLSAVLCAVKVAALAAQRGANQALVASLQVGLHTSV